MKDQSATLARIRAHHDQLGRTMADHATTIARSVDRLTSPAARRETMALFCAEEVLSHATVEENTLYTVASELPAIRLLVSVLRDEHATLQALNDDLVAAVTLGEIVSASAALNAVFQTHLQKENEILLPALVSGGVDLAAVLGDTHEILGGDGAVVLEQVDELDVRRLVPAQRHERIFAAYGRLAAGSAFVLVNDHDPKPLYYQFAAEHPGAFTWRYVESGPTVWKVRIGRP
ncbi:DUF2249 domain-containing protein [Streptosporangium saharense]|uniref:DUF2249 domain-containing protein n=1 Tax=Streptosporangium saharense TaxID=1706840 RepID=UPI00367AD697